jgi:hypothetical protein
MTILLKSKKIFILFAGAFLLIAIVEIWSANRLATFGEEMSRIENAEQKLSLENQLLEDQIAKSASLMTLEKSALSLGFNKAAKVVYINLPSLALKH